MYERLEVCLQAFEAVTPEALSNEVEIQKRTLRQTSASELLENHGCFLEKKFGSKFLGSFKLPFSCDSLRIIFVLFFP